MRDIVVVIPGITGSVLQKDGKDIWGLSGTVLGSALFNRNDWIEQLKLNGNDDPEADDLGDGITASRIIEIPHLIPGLAKSIGYTELSSLITKNFEVTEGDIYNNDKPANFFKFYYDWRRDNRVTARLLKRLLDERLKQWRECTGNKNAKVIILAHSMGGLVSRYYVEVLEGWRDCKALFTFGTPHRGSVKAVNFLANGYKQLFLELTEVMRSLTSIYQLLPIYETLQIGNEYYRIGETDNLPNIDKTRAADALKFHRKIEAAVKINIKDENYKKDFTTIPIVGIKQPTFQSALLANGKLSVSEKLPRKLQSRPDLSDGDGTVPQVSAIPIELSNGLNNNFIAETHGSLQNQSQMLDNLFSCLNLNQFDLAGVRAPQSAISLSLDDLYLPSELIEIRGRVISFSPTHGKLKAKITSVSHSETALNLDFEEQEKEWVLAIDNLKPGLYRLQVETENSGEQFPTLVHDFFEVFNANSTNS